MSTESNSLFSGLLNKLGDLGFFIRRNITGLGYAARMFALVLFRSGSLLKRPRLVSDQVLFVGNYSFVIITVSGLFVGFVLGLQGYYTLTRYGSEQALGLLVALSLTRELGPVITALLLWAGIISMPILATIFTAVGVLGGYLVGVPLIGVDSGAFWSQMQGGVDLFDDIGNGFIKSIVFGFAVTFIALYQGYEAKPTPEGVSQATTRTVVLSSLAVLALDFLLTAMMFSNN